MLADGRIAYRIKPARKGATHRILEPLELLARIAALIPPPRHPFLRYHGVLAPSSKWRASIVPRAVDEGRAPTPNRAATLAHPNATAATAPTHSSATGVTRMPTMASPPARAGAASPATPPRDHAEPPPARALPPESSAHPPHRAAFARIPPAHLTRLGGREWLARTERIEWSKLLRRTFAADVLTCPRCTGRARIIAAVQNPAAARAFLDALDERSIPIRSNARTRDDDDRALDLDLDLDLDMTDDRPRHGQSASAAHGQSPGPEATERPDEIDEAEAEDLDAPSSSPARELPDD